MSITSFKLTKQVVIVAGLKISTAILVFLYSYLIGKFIGADGLGVFQTILSFILSISIIAGLGFKNATLRLVTSKIATKDYLSAISIYQKAIFFIGILTVSLTIFCLLFLDSIFLFFTPENEQLIPCVLIMVLAIIPLTFNSLLAELLKAFDKIQLSIYVQNGFSYLFAVLIFGICWLCFEQIELAQIIISFTISLWISFFIALFCFQRYKIRSSAKNTGLEEFWWRNLTQNNSELFASAMPLWIVSITSIIIQYLDVFLIGILIGTKEAGIYFVAKKIALLNSLLLDAANTVLAPKFANLYARKELIELKKIAQDATKLLLFGGFISFCFCSIFSKSILGLFGPEFIEGWYLLVILSFGQFINLMVGSTDFLLIMTGYETLFRDNVIFSSVLTLVLYFVLIPVFSVTGIAIAVALGTIVQNCRGVWLVKEKK